MRPLQGRGVSAQLKRRAACALSLLCMLSTFPMLCMLSMLCCAVLQVRDAAETIEEERAKVEAKTPITEEVGV